MAKIQKPDSLKVPLQDIKLATNNFSEDNFIGKGGFGRVYKGQLLPQHSTITGEPITTVAIKKLENTIAGPEFELEIIVLASYKHSNLVPLVGFCDNGDHEKLLVYEYEINGSLDKHVASIDLKWEQRLQICLDVARGLEYLHGGGVGTTHRVVHGYIKSCNILLDANWEAKISDFGLSKICKMNQNDFGTYGYVDPQYQKTGVVTKESDVYAFGVVLFEVLCGRLAVMEEYQDERKFLSKFVKRSYKSEKFDEIIMGDLREQMKPYSLELFSGIAYKCLNKDGKQRPSTKSIVQELQSSFDYQIGSPSRLWGSSTGGSPWSLLLGNNLKLRKITIDHKDWIFSIGFTVEDLSGSLISSQYGGSGGLSGGEISELNFYPEEEMIGITGTVGKTTGSYAGYEVISSLCIVTNERRHGPFGEETETRFSIPWDVGSFAGFYGRAGFYLDGLGFYSMTTM